MDGKLDRFNHWRNDDKKVHKNVPGTVKSAINNLSNNQFNATDCSADPCTCTGCSDWD